MYCNFNDNRVLCVSRTAKIASFLQHHPLLDTPFVRQRCHIIVRISVSTLISLHPLPLSMIRKIHAYAYPPACALCIFAEKLSALSIASTASLEMLIVFFDTPSILLMVASRSFHKAHRSLQNAALPFHSSPPLPGFPCLRSLGVRSVSLVYSARPRPKIQDAAAGT